MLDKIVRRKRAEIAQAQEKLPADRLSAQIPEEPPPSLGQALSRPDRVNIIAEVKYSSPSHGAFSLQWEPEEIAEAYQKGGAAAVSVLTDKHFFKGDPEYLSRLRRRFEAMPLLRKDFILDRYQAVEARVWGASALLLIVACLEPQELCDLRSYSQELGLEALVEVHDRRELDIALESGGRIIGVNNRNLKTFKVDLETSFRLARHVEGESGLTLVSESGISESVQIQELRDAGYSAFLIGSNLMNSSDPAAQLRGLTQAPIGTLTDAG